MGLNLNLNLNLGLGLGLGLGVGDSPAQESKVVNLLLVDDSRLNRRMMARLLDVDDGYCCDEAEDGVQAVERVRDKLPLAYDAILMDFMMVRTYVCVYVCMYVCMYVCVYALMCVRV
jgi:hypothetical protein